MNNRFGHEAGDKVMLCTVAEVIEKTLGGLVPVSAAMNFGRPDGLDAAAAAAKMQSGGAGSGYRTGLFYCCRCRRRYRRPEPVVRAADQKRCWQLSREYYCNGWQQAALGRIVFEMLLLLAVLGQGGKEFAAIDRFGQVIVHAAGQ